MIGFLDTFNTIKPGDRRLQLFHCWCHETGLTRFHNSFTALKQWLEGTSDGIAAVYLLPTPRDAEIAVSHLAADDALAPLVTSTSPEARRVLVLSCQDFINEKLVDKTLARRGLVIVLDLGVGTVLSHVSATAAVLFAELQPRDQSPLRTLSIMVLQQMPPGGRMGNYLLDMSAVGQAVSHKGWQVVLYNARTGSAPKARAYHHPPPCRLNDAGYDELQVANALGVLEEGFQAAQADGQADAAYKAVVLMSRERFRRLVGSVTFTRARSLLIHDRTPAKVVQAICGDEGPGLTVIGITDEVGIMPRVKGLQLLIEDSTVEMPYFDDTTGHSVTRDTASVHMWDAYFVEIGQGMATDERYRLWDTREHRPRKPPVLFPAHHTGDMFHLLIRLADAFPGQSLERVPCMTAPSNLPVLYERMRRLELWGIAEQAGGGVRLTVGKGRLISDLARHEANIHSLVLLAGAADPSLELSAEARHLLVWLAAVAAHDPQRILASPGELPRGTQLGGPANIAAQRGGIWSALLGVQGFSCSGNAGAGTQQSQRHPVEATEAQQVLDSVAFWVEKLSLPAVDAGAPITEGVQPHEMAVAERQLVCAFIYSIAMFDVGGTSLVDLLSGAELCLGGDATAELVAAGQRAGEPVVFAIYTDLRRSARGISPRNLTVVSHDAVYAELVKIAPRANAPPGASPIDLEILRPRTAPPLEPEPSAAPAQADWVAGEVDWEKPG